MTSKPSRKELIEELVRMMENIERLPATAMINAINHYDFCALLMLLVEILKEDNLESK